MKNDSYSPIFLSIPDHPSSLDDDDMFLVIASDGVWDTMSSDLVAKFVIVNTCKIVMKICFGGLHVRLVNVFSLQRSFASISQHESLLRIISTQISKRAR